MDFKALCVGLNTYGTTDYVSHTTFVNKFNWAGAYTVARDREVLDMRFTFLLKALEVNDG